MKPSTLKTTGRILYAVPFILFGLYRFMSMDFFIELSPDWLPAPGLWISMVGFGLVAAGISFIAGRWVYLSGLMLAGMIIILACCVHVPNTINNWNDPTMRSISMAMTVKDFVAAGGALFIAASFRADRMRKAQLNVDKNEIVYSSFDREDVKASA